MSFVKTIRKKTQLRQLYKEHAGDYRPMQLAFLLQDWDDPYNVGGMFRIADACGAHEIVMCGKTPTPPHPQIHVTSMGQHRRVTWRHLGAKSDEAAKALKAEGYSLVAVEIAEGATHYMEFEYPEKLCLVLGSEGAGVFGNVMKQCDGAVFIPMAGKGRSLNVHVAAAVVAFEVLLGTQGQATP